ncbi:CubicO group peptidase (beta-lactamase class C family) [Sporosarcina luteola]|nr:CubicO group peptidase (beta-lactamase class C family) [Sporosarcina luteola]
MRRNDWPSVNWKVENPETCKIDSAKLSEVESIVRTEYHNLNGLVVIKNGFIAYEKYFNGSSSNDLHHVASVTKSIVSALIGIAIDAGFIKNEDQKVLDFFPEYVADPVHQQKQDISIRHLLTMTAPYAFEDWHEPLDKMCMESNWVEYALNMLGQQGTVGTFKYSTAGAHLLSAIITRSTGKSSREFANEYLFKPIGMKEIPLFEIESYDYDHLFGKDVKGWVHDPNGYTTGGWGLTLTTRDMARFGYLYLNQGKWDTKQIIPQHWIQETTTMNSNNYGYLWWLREENGVFAYVALGDGGNVICCIPEQDIVIAISSEFMVNPADRWPLIMEYIIPAVSA